MILSKWIENFPIEFKYETQELNEESTLFFSSGFTGDLFDFERESDHFTKMKESDNLISSETKTNENEIYNVIETENFPKKPNIFKWDVKKLAKQITLIICKHLFFHLIFHKNKILGESFYLLSPLDIGSIKWRKEKKSSFKTLIRRNEQIGFWVKFDRIVKLFDNQNFSKKRSQRK